MIYLEYFQHPSSSWSKYCMPNLSSCLASTKSLEISSRLSLVVFYLVLRRDIDSVSYCFWMLSVVWRWFRRLFFLIFSAPHAAWYQPFSKLNPFPPWVQPFSERAPHYYSYFTVGSNVMLKLKKLEEQFCIKLFYSILSSWGIYIISSNDKLTINFDIGGFSLIKEKYRLYKIRILPNYLTNPNILK